MNHIDCEEDLFNQLWIEHYPICLKIAYTLAINLDCEPEDIVQMAMLKAYLNFKNHRNIIKNWRIWLSTIVKNVALNEIRNTKCRRSHEWPLDSDLDIIIGDSTANEPESIFLANERYRSLINTLKRLPKKFGQVLWLQANGYTYAEIAHLTNVPLGTVRSRISRGRKTLDKYMHLAA